MSEIEYTIVGIVTHHPKESNPADWRYTFLVNPSEEGFIIRLKDVSIRMFGFSQAFRGVPKFMCDIRFEGKT